MSAHDRSLASGMPLSPGMREDLHAVGGDAFARDTDSLINAWLANLESGCKDEATNPAFIAMSIAMPASDPEQAWTIILEGIRRASSDKILGIIGASSIENFLGHHGEQFIDRVEEEAAANPRFRTSLAHMWKSGEISEPVWERVRRLQQATS